MAELDPLVAEILLKGDDEFLGKLKKIGDEAASAFSELNKAVEEGISNFGLAAAAIGLVEHAISSAVAATTQFIEEQTELSQKTILLGQAFGTTAGQLQELEAIFASSGVKVDQFERFANRLTITIAREWPQIAESIKTYANENDAATLRVTSATLRIRDAQNAVADNSEERAARAQRDNDAIAQSFLKLQTAAQHAANEQRDAYLAVQNATLAVTAAEQHLAELQGRPPSDAAKQQLAIDQAQAAVENARQAETEARLAQQEKAAQAALKQAQLEQDYDDLRRKAAKAARDDAEQREKDENAVKEAIIARGEAEQRAAKLALTNISSIRDALDGIVKGNRDVATQIDLTQVSVHHLTDAIIAQAAEHSKATTPTGYELLSQLSKTLAADTGHLIDQQQRLAIVNRLAQTSMQALGASGAEILNVLEHDSEALQKFTDKTSALDVKTAQHNIEAFRGALASLNLTVSILSQQFAAAIAPAFTAFLKAIETSLESNTGLLHNFISGLQELVQIVVRVVAGIDIFLNKSGLFDEIIGKADLLKAAIVGIGTALVAATGPIGAIVVAIGLVITAIGAIRDNWDTITEHVKKAWDAVKDNEVVKFLEGVLDVITRIVKGIGIIVAAAARLGGIGANNPDASATGNAQSGAGEGGSIQGHAEGGPIRGPGSGTSDSILARLSNGEFVMRAAAVQNYGADFFHALNSMMLPGFASGGLVASPVRLAGGGAQPTSVLNLSLDGRSFNGFRGPKSTVDDLSSFAIARQTSAAGKNPSWMG